MPSDIGLNQLVQGWLAYVRTKDDGASWASDFVWQLAADDPNRALNFVFAVLSTGPEDFVLGTLAAGPLEDVLAKHGPDIIRRIEEESRRSPEFRHLLGGVWQNAMPDEIWQRVLKAAPVRW